MSRMRTYRLSIMIILAAILGSFMPVNAATQKRGLYAPSFSRASEAVEMAANTRPRTGVQLRTGVQYRRYTRPRAYNPRPFYNSRPFYNPRSTYRRCEIRPQIVRTPSGYVRRNVRVCR